MADKTSVSDWSVTPVDNDNIAGIRLSERQTRVDAMNDAQREMMAQVKVKFDATDQSIAATNENLAEVDSNLQESLSDGLEQAQEALDTVNQQLTGSISQQAAALQQEITTRETSVADLANSTALSFSGVAANIVALTATDAALSTRIDAVSGGARKEPVAVATTANGTLASAFANGQTVDGVVLATGNRILIKNQTNAAQNGVHTVNASGAPTRATDSDNEAKLVGSMYYVIGGTANSGRTFGLATPSPITVGTTELSFVQTSGDPTGLAGQVSTLTTKTAALNTQGTIAAATTTDIASVGTDFVIVTGTGIIIDNLGTPAGNPLITVKFNSAGLTLQHGTGAGQINLGSGLASITTQAGDTMVCKKRSVTSSYWEVISYKRANGTAIVGATLVDVVKRMRRPGDALALYTTTLVGAPALSDPAPVGTINNGSAGAKLNVAGGHAPIAPRELNEVEAGKRYRVTVKVQRNTNPTAQALKWGVQWLTNAKASNGQTLVPIAALSAAGGPAVFSAVFSTAAGPGVDYIIPAGTVYSKELFSAQDEADGNTGLIGLKWDEVISGEGGSGVQPARHIACFGDSNMQGTTTGGIDPWHVVAAARLGGATMSNFGIGGTRATSAGVTNRNFLSFFRLAEAVYNQKVARDVSDPVAEAAAFNDAKADAQAIFDGGGQDYRPIVSAIEATNWLGVSHVMIGYGTNDYHGPGPTGVAIGTMADTSGATFIGAMRRGVKYLLDAYPHLQFILETPAYRRVSDMVKASDPMQASEDSDDAVNGSGHTLQDYAQAVRDVAAERHFPVIDLNRTIGVNALNHAVYLPDGLHFAQNAAGVALAAAKRASGILANF